MCQGGGISKIGLERWVLFFLLRMMKTIELGNHVLPSVTHP